MSLVTTVKAYWSIMQPEDAQALALSFLATLLLGCSMIGGFIWLANKQEEKRAERRRKEDDEAVERALKARAERQGRPYKKPEGKTVPTKPKGKDLPKPPAGQSRHIPLESQEALILRGREQLAAGKPDKALVTYLTLLYSAAESRDGNALPANLTECLRGAAECYRKLGDPESAVKFFQAERRIFEEVVVSAANAGRPQGERRKTGGILQSLLNPGAPVEEEDLPRRCQTLSEVADACTRLGRHDVALAYRVKAAAVKQKVTGKALDERSPEFAAMAAALAKVQESGVAEKAIKEATRGENAVPKDSPLLHMLQQRQQKDADIASPSGTGPSAGPPDTTPPNEEDAPKSGERSPGQAK